MNRRRAGVLLALLLGCKGVDRPTDAARAETPDALPDVAQADRAPDLTGSEAPADHDAGGDAWLADARATDDLAPPDVHPTDLPVLAPDAAGDTAIDARTADVVVVGADLAPDGPSESRFVATGSMADTRLEHTATLLSDGKVLVTGSYYNGAYTYLSTATIYDPTTRTFSSTGSMHANRGEHTATLLANGNVLVTGGTDYYGTHGSAEIYDPKQGTFSVIGNMTIPRVYHRAVLLDDGRVLIVGGYSSGTTNTAELFDPGTGTFTATGSMAERRQAFDLTTLADGRVLVVGGNSRLGVMGDFTNTATAEIYDPATKTFKLTGSMSRARSYATVTRLPDGKVLVAGGHDGTGTATAELFDPALGTFSMTGSMTEMRTWTQRATLLSTGKVLVTGGTNRDFVYLASAEIYDPATGQFSPAGRMTTARGYHTATLLTDGSVLIAGGKAASAKILSSAEIFR
jgi:hypothetical protein